jgi:hypothetical protein
VVAAEDFQNAVKAGFQVDGPGQCLARIEQGSEAPDFT